MNWIQNNWVLLTYFVSIIYCAWRFRKSYSKNSLDGVIGTSPGLDTIAASLIAPILAAADIIVTIVKWIIKKLK